MTSDEIRENLILVPNELLVDALNDFFPSPRDLALRMNQYLDQMKAVNRISTVLNYDSILYMCTYLNIIEIQKFVSTNRYFRTLKSKIHRTYTCSSRTNTKQPEAIKMKIIPGLTLSINR